MLDHEHQEQQQQTLQRLATQHAATAQQLASRRAQLQGLLHDVDALASDYGSALKTRSSVQAPLHARQARLQQRTSQLVAAAMQPVRVQWADAAETETRARQAAWTAMQEEVRRIGCKQVYKTARRQVATLRATVQQQSAALQEAAAARQSLQQQADGRAAALHTAQSQLATVQQQLADTRQQLAEAQRAGKEALVEAEARHGRELAQRDALHAPLLAHLKDWVARSPQQRMSISGAPLPKIPPMESVSGGFVTGAALAAAAREEHARETRPMKAAPVVPPKEAATPARVRVGPALLSPSPGTLPRRKKSPVPRRGGVRPEASQGADTRRVSPLEALASVMLDTADAQPGPQGPQDPAPSSAERRAAWLTKQQARLQAKAAALVGDTRPVARRLATEEQSGGARCVKCGVTEGQAANPRYAACRFHPALMEDPGALKFTPSWYSCRRAAHTAKQPGCFVRPHGHTFADVTCE